MQIGTLAARHWRPLALTVLIALVYGNTLGNSLHLDDAYRIAQNPEVEQVRPLLRHFTDPRTSATLPQLATYRPLLPLSLSTNNAVSDAVGLDRLAGYHLGNLSVHLATCLLVFLLVREFLRNSSTRRPDRAENLAFAAALLFGLHPVSGVPVNYISARDLLMAVLLMTAALLGYVRMRRRRGDSAIGWSVALGCLGLSLLAKQNAVLFPGLVLFFETTVMGASIRDRGPWLRAAAFALPIAAFFVWTEAILGFSDLDSVTSSTVAPVIYFLTQMKLHFSYYLRNFVWPFYMRPQPLIEQSAGFGDLWAIGALALVCGVLALAWRARRRAPLASWSVFAYAVLLAPTSSFRPFHDLAVDYRQYPGLPFLCLLLVLAIDTLATRVGGGQRTRLAGACLAVFALYFGAASFWMNRIWRTDETFWEQSVRYGASARGHLNYGHAIQVEDPDLAEHHYRKALELAPGYVHAYINLGMLQMIHGKTAEGLATVKQAVEVAPEWALSHHWMGVAYRQAGDLLAGHEASRRAADLDPRNVEYQYQAAFDLYSIGELADSLSYLERIHAVIPSYKESLFLEGFALQQLGRWAEGEPLYRRYLEQNPGNAQVWFNLGYGLANAGDCGAALPNFEKCLELEPTHQAASYWAERCR